MAEISYVSSVLDLIGNTPAVSLSRLVAQLGLKGKIIAKIEYFNPGLSKKDRIALEMIEEAERKNILRPGQTVLELTSGNTGTGLAIVCSWESCSLSPFIIPGILSEFSFHPKTAFGCASTSLGMLYQGIQVHCCDVSW